MQSIESLNTALDKCTGRPVFVSHDREFVSSLATRVLELRPATAMLLRRRRGARGARDVLDFDAGRPAAPVVDIGRPAVQQHHGRAVAGPVL
jgi:hypothetical protein